MACSIRSQSLLSRLGAAAALLTCFAVVLDVGGWSERGGRKLLQAKSVQAEAAPILASVSPAGSGTDGDTQPGQSPLLMPVMDLSEFKVFETASSSARDVGRSPSTAPPHATIVGIWAPDVGSCSLRDFRQGLLPTIINTDGAWAGETFCTFTNQKQTPTGWRVVANCVNADERWTAQVRLTIKGDRLTWSSRRGTQIYRRCTPDFRTAEVQ